MNQDIDTVRRYYEDIRRHRPLTGQQFKIRDLIKYSNTFSDSNGWPEGISNAGILERQRRGGFALKVAVPISFRRNVTRPGHLDVIKLSTEQCFEVWDGSTCLQPAYILCVWDMDMTWDLCTLHKGRERVWVGSGIIYAERGIDSTDMCRLCRAAA